MAFNVLVVDDSTSMRAVVKKIVKISGFDVGECWEAADGKEAMQVLSDHWVDIVLTDISMPNMSGLELVAEMKRDQLLRFIPVVMVSTEGTEKRIQECMEMGASGYIKKPFQPEDVKETLGRIMGEAGGRYGESESGGEAGDF